MARKQEIVITGVTEVKDLARELRKHADGKEIRKMMIKEFRRAIKPMAKAAKTGALELPSKGENARRGRPSLRLELSKAVSTQIKLSGRSAGVRVFVNPKRMPEGKKSLAKHVEGTPGWQIWRHPVFGHDVWVTQEPHPFFTTATRPAEPAAQRAIKNVVDQIQRDLEHGK